MGDFDSWKFAQQIIVHNPNDTDLLNFQVSMVIPPDWAGWADANPDGSDIRFSDESGNAIPYYIEELTQTYTEKPILRGDKNPGQAWKYLADTTPDDTWINIDFDDSSWTEAEAPIGDTGPYRTNLSFTDLYLRRLFTLPSGVTISSATLRVASDDGAEAWINGTKVLDNITDTHAYSYWNYEVDVTNAIQAGDNILAIHVHNASSYNYFDAELEIVMTTSSGYWAKIWVKIPLLKANSDTTIYIYSGNDSATDASDPTSVFEFFDDFETWEGWVKYGNGVVSQTSDYVKHGSYALKKTTANDPNGGVKAIGQTLGRNIILEYWNYRIDNNGGPADRVGVVDDNGNGYGHVHSCYDNKMGVDVRSNYSGTTYSTAFNHVINTWYWCKLIITDSDIISEMYSEDMTLLARYVRSGDTTYDTFTQVYVFGGYNYVVDLLRIRKYAPAEPTWEFGSIGVNWLSGWRSRNKITISNSTTNELTDYPVRIALDANWDGWQWVKSDGADIRVTDMNNNILPYWVESIDPDAKTAIIWAKVPSIPAGVDDGSGNITPGTVDVYLYYNNPDATDAGDPTAVFDWYDDASTDKSSSYTIVDLYNSGVNTTFTYDATNKRYVITTNNDTDGIVVNGLTLTDAEVIVKGIFNPSTSSGGNQQLGAVLRYSTDGVYYARYETLPSPDKIDIMKQATPPNTTETNLASVDLSGDATDGTEVTLVAKAIGSALSLEYVEGGATVTATDSDYTSGQFGIFAGYDDGGEIYITFLRIRKIADPEPTFTIASREDILTYYTFTKRVKLQLTDSVTNEDVELVIDDKFQAFWKYRGVKIGVVKGDDTLMYPYVIVSETTDHISIVVKGVTGTPDDVFWLYFDDGQERDTSNLDDTFAPANLAKKFKIVYNTADPYVIYDVTFSGFGGKLKESDLANLTVVDGNTGAVVAHRVVSYEVDDSRAITSLRLQVRAAYATDTRTFYLYLVGKGQTFDTPDTYIYPIATAGWSLLWEQKSVGVSTSILLDGNSFNVTEYDVGYRRNSYHFDIEEGESYNLPSSNYSRVFRLRLVATDDELATLHTIMKRPYITVDWLGEEFYGQIIELRYRKDARRPMVYEVELTVERVRVI